MKKGSIKYLLVLALFALVPCAFSATYHVSTTGSATGAGTTEDPMTIDAAIAAALAQTEASEIVLAAGTYEPTAATGGSSSHVRLIAPVTIRSASHSAADVTISAKTRRLEMYHPEAKLLSVTIDGGGARRTDNYAGCIYFPNVSGLTSCGIVSNCVIRKGFTDNSGGGIRMDGPGLVTHSIFTDNKFRDNNNAYGSAVYINHDNAVVRNCLITKGSNETWSDRTYYGAVGISKGLLESCTIAGNTHNKWSGVYATGGTVRNCIIGANTQTSKGVSLGYENVQVYNSGNATFEYCVTPTYVAGTGNIIIEEPFVDAANGNYYPRAINTIVDAGSNQAWMMGSFDLDGNQRICTTVEGKSHTVDIGAYESLEVPVAEASVSFVINGASSGVAPCSISFVATAVNFGAAENVIYMWDFGDDTTKEVTGEASVSHEYTQPGIRTVSLKVRNDVAGIEPIDTEPLTVTIVGEKFYVAKAGSNEAPYATLATAAHDINDVLNISLDGCDVEIAADTYTITEAATITKQIHLYGATGKPEDVIVQRGSKSHGIFKIRTNATVSSLTIQGGVAEDNDNGGNVTIWNGGTVTNCIIRNGYSDAYNGGGGGVQLSAGLVTHCIITNNTGANNDSAGGVVWLRNTDSVVRNCLIAENRQDGGNNKSSFGTGVRIGAGLLESCTIARNSSDKCAGVWAQGGTILNCLIGENTTASDDPNAAVYAGTASYFNSCAAPVLINENCLLVPSPFVSAATGDYRPTLGETSAINGAQLKDWMENAKDLAGNDRVLNGAPDIGAYEVDPSTIKSLNFSADKTQGFAPLAVTFTAQPSNLGEADDLRYVWTIDGEALDPMSSPEWEHDFTDFGEATVTLTVQNTSTGASFTSATTLTITVLPKTLYVSNDGNGIWPYATPETATNNLVAAVDATFSGATVLVKAGEYTLDSPIDLTHGVIIRGETQNPADVIVKRGEKEHRLFAMNHNEAVLSGLTLQGGTVSGNGNHGANVAIMTGGTVTNCVIRNGSTPGYNSSGAGVSVTGAGLVTHCVITENTSANYDASGGAVYIANSGAIVRNCLIVGNSQVGGNDNNLFGAGVKMTYGKLENCTIVSNSSARCAGVWASEGKVLNCLIDGNLVTDETLDDALKTQYAVWAGSASAFTYCAAPTVINSAANSGCVVLTKDPFKNFAIGNYHLAEDAEVVNKALQQSWMTGATDLAGNPRMLPTGKPDIGCYELRRGFHIIVR